MIYLENSASVVSGQQIGILGGPLLVLLKIVGVLKTAAEKKLKPIFWLETNDADFDEIKKSYYLNKKGEILSFTWDINSRGRPLGLLKVDKNLLLGIKSFLENIKITAFTPRLREMINFSYVKGRSFSEASESFYRAFFSDYPVEFFNPQEKKFIDFSQDFLLKEVKKTKVGEQSKAFLLKDEKREALFKKKDGFYLRSGEKVLEPLYPLLPHLYTRSILQDSYLNAQYYLGGRSEVAYLKSKGILEQYHFYKVSPAQVIPRMELSIVRESDEKSFLEKGISLDELIKTPVDLLKKKWLKKKSGIDLEKIQKKLFEIKENYVKELKILDLDSSRLEKKLYLSHKHFLGGKRKALYREYQKELLEIKRLSSLYSISEDVSQRRLSLAYYYNEYGEEFIKKIYNLYQNNKEVTLVL